MTTTKKMEEFFNLPPTESTLDENKSEEKINEETTDIVEFVDQMPAATTAEKVEMALPVVNGLEKHDSEMDDIAKKAIDTFEDLIALGGNVPDMHAGKIFEVAGQMLKTALDAKNAKAEKKLRMIELQLKKLRAEQIDFENGVAGKSGLQGGEFDRNELIKYIVSTKTDDKS